MRQCANIISKLPNIKNAIVLIVVWITSFAGAAVTQAMEPDTPAAPSTRPGEVEKLSDAERISRLQRTIDDDVKRLEQLKGQRDDPKGEYAEAEAGFTELDKKLTGKKRALPDSGNGGLSKQSQEELASLEKNWKLAKDRFDLAIQQRKTLQEQIIMLEQKQQQDKEALQKLSGTPTTQPVEATAQVPVALSSSQPAIIAPVDSPVPVPSPLTPINVVEKVLQGGAKGGDSAQTPAAPLLTPKPPSKELIKASEEAMVKQQAAKQAQSEAKTISDRLDALHKSIELERRQLDAAQKKADNAQESARAMREEWQRKWKEGAAQSALQDLLKKVDDADTRTREARAEAMERSRRLDSLNADLADVQSEQISALREADRKAKEAQQAQTKVDELRNPLAPKNLWRWIVESGPRVLGILLGMAVLLFLVRVPRIRLLTFLIHTTERGTIEEQQNRARTLASVFSSAATIAIMIGGALMVFTEIGVNILPLLGGAAVIGLAVAFGAQNLIRDYFTGFMILLENQYGINDVVTLCGVSGQVERITLRMTVLRDLEGVVHFIPNGQITTVSNKTHGWSRAVIEIGVAYKEDVDRVMQVAMDLAREARKDPKLADAIVEDPEMLGVENLGDWAVAIKFVMKTRPGKNWVVKREMLRRIKRRFQELNIEIPSPPQGYAPTQVGPRVVP